MFEAVRTVAEQSFFAVAEPSDDRSFGGAAVQVPRGLVATVRFEQGPLAGSVSCTLPETLANGLFDAFTGRDPGEPAPISTLVHDLVGEFSNMVCGAWLTRHEGIGVWQRIRQQLNAGEMPADDLIGKQPERVGGEGG